MSNDVYDASVTTVCMYMCVVGWLCMSTSQWSEAALFSSRMSTNLTEQSESRWDFKKNPGHVCIALACHVMYRIYYI